jgi:hypothetical protein
MRITGLVTVVVLFLGASLVFGNAVQPVDGILPTYGAETGYNSENPPPVDSICLVFAGVDYGGNFSSPQNYVNAKHMVNVEVGSYYFPVVIWETGTAWGSQSLFSYWDDLFKFWSYPDSFTTNNGQDTGRPAVCADSHGNLHFAWHQTGSPDGYETFYARAFLDTSAGVIQYNVERPAQFISATNGEEESFPVIAIYGDTLVVCAFNVGTIGGEHAVHYNYSTDGGNTWAGVGTAYEHGTVMPGSWILPSIAPDPTSGDMWVTINFDMSGDGSEDIVALHWDAGANSWSNETVANATSMHPYVLSSVVVDNAGIPHCIFQENLTTTGGIGGLTGWNQCGPAGTLMYTHRQSGSWSTPSKIIFPFYTQRSYAAGHPSAGLIPNGDIGFSTTLPDSITPDTSSAYMPFNVHYGEIAAYSAATLTYGGKVSGIPWQDTKCAIFAHTTYNIPADGPGITWCQLDAAVPPADVYYNHKALVGIEEGTGTTPSPVALYQNYPNPSHGKTMIRFSIPSNTSITLDIHDIAGRLVRTLATGIPGSGNYFVVWDGKDAYGKDAPGGVYLYTLTAGKYSETKKLLLIQ